MNEDRATRYHRLKRRALVLSLAWSGILFTALLATGGSLQLRATAERIAAALGRSSPAVVVVLYVAGLILLHEAGGFILALYSSFIVEHRYGLSNERFTAWLWDQAKALSLGLVLGAAAASLIYVFIRWSPGRWWLPAGAVFSLIIVGLANVAPVLLLPLFYRVKPLDREALRTRLMALAERSGARVIGACEWGLADKTKKANAALASLGGTRRILVSDTMLAGYSDEEIEIVLAHELAHHARRHLEGNHLRERAGVRRVFLAARMLDASVGPLGLEGVADPAGLPLLLLAAGAVSVVMLPATFALSRTFERSADRFALEPRGIPARSCRRCVGWPRRTSPKSAPRA